MTTKKILLVCMGNICRSPMAEGIVRDMIRERGLPITTDSAGTINNHVDEAPDPRAQACMLEHKSDISDLRARQIRSSDFIEFDLLLAMDRDNLDGLRRIAPSSSLATKAKLIMDYAPIYPVSEVPDPYYGGAEGFEVVHRMLTAACSNLLDELQANDQ
jgi:protein-tyrosine phosphatase